jgi:hypothetical protein
MAIAATHTMTHSVDTYSDKLDDAMRYVKQSLMYLFFCVGDNSYDYGDESDSYEAVELTMLRSGGDDDDEKREADKILQELTDAQIFYCEHYVSYGTQIEGSYRTRTVERQKALEQICATFSPEHQPGSLTKVELRRGFMAYQKAIELSPRPSLRWTLIQEFEKIKAQHDLENDYDKEGACAALQYAEDSVNMPTERLKHYVQAIRYTNDVVDKELVRQEFEKFFHDVEQGNY